MIVHTFCIYSIPEPSNISFFNKNCMILYTSYDKIRTWKYCKGLLIVCVDKLLQWYFIPIKSQCTLCFEVHTPRSGRHCAFSCERHCFFCIGISHKDTAIMAANVPGDIWSAGNFTSISQIPTCAHFGVNTQAVGEEFPPCNGSNLVDTLCVSLIWFWLHLKCRPFFLFISAFDPPGQNLNPSSTWTYRCHSFGHQNRMTHTVCFCPPTGNWLAIHPLSSPKLTSTRRDLHWWVRKNFPSILYARIFSL